MPKEFSSLSLRQKCHRIKQNIDFNQRLNESRQEQKSQHNQQIVESHKRDNAVNSNSDEVNSKIDWVVRGSVVQGTDAPFMRSMHNRAYRHFNFRRYKHKLTEKTD